MLKNKFYHFMKKLDFWSNLESNYKSRYEDAVATDDGVFVVWRDVDVKNIFAKYIPLNSADPSSLEILTISSEQNSIRGIA